MIKLYYFFCGIIYLKGNCKFIARFARQIKPLKMVAFPSPKYDEMRHWFDEFKKRNNHPIDKISKT